MKTCGPKSKKLNNNRAITLVALIITIIVLLILVGASINVLGGENGIVKQAIKAKNEMKKAQIKEEVMMAWQNCEIEYVERSVKNSSIKREDVYTEDNLNTYLKGSGVVSELKYQPNSTSTFLYSTKNTETYTITIDANNYITIEEKDISNENTDDETSNVGTDIFATENIHRAFASKLAERGINYNVSMDSWNGGTLEETRFWGGVADLSIGTDVMVKKQDSSEYQDRFISDSRTTSAVNTSSPFDLTGDFKINIDLQQFRNTFEAINESCRSSDNNYYYERLLPVIAINGEFNLDIMYNEKMQIDDSFLEYGNMIGFDDITKEIFVDTNRTDKGHADDANIPEGYRMLRIYLKLKAPTSEELRSTAHFEETKDMLVYGDLDAHYQTLFNHIEFVIPRVTVSTTELLESKYYTLSASMNGHFSYDCNVNFNVSSQQIDGKANNYTGVQDWQKISATIALLKRTSGGGGRWT